MEKHDQCSGPDELNELLLYNYIKWVALVRVAVGRTRAIYCCSCAWALSMAPKFSQFSPKKREREQCREVQFRVSLY